MKLAIFTLPLHVNYGGILQAYALQSVLQRMGHEVFLYDTPFPPPPLSRKKRLLRRLLRILLLGKEFQSKPRHRMSRKESYRRRHILRFLHDTFRMRVLSSEQDGLEAVVVGSDQIWRPLYFPSIEMAFLSYTEDWTDVRRVAYACSFGADEPEYTDVQVEVCGNLLTRFDAVSIREDRMASIMKDVYRWKCNPVHVLDPTMLLSVDDYRAMYRKASPAISRRVKNTLFCYILDPNDEKDRIRECLLAEQHATILTQTDLSPRSDSLSDGDYASLESWVHAFDETDLVLTDSFHGCVFSILFHKPFVAIGNKGRGMARFLSLLSMFGLEDRLILDASGFHPDLMDRPIDWERIDERLERYRADSFAFLHKCLM